MCVEWRELGGAEWNKTGIVVVFFPAEDGIRYLVVTGVQRCALPILLDLARQNTRGRSAAPWRRSLLPLRIRSAGDDRGKSQERNLPHVPGSPESPWRRSEELRVRQACRSRPSPFHQKKNLSRAKQFTRHLAPSFSSPHAWLTSFLDFPRLFLTFTLLLL